MSQMLTITVIVVVVISNNFEASATRTKRRRFQNLIKGPFGETAYNCMGLKHCGYNSMFVVVVREF